LCPRRARRAGRGGCVGFVDFGPKVHNVHGPSRAWAHAKEKPQIGDRRPRSPLGEIQPDHWLPEYTTELLNVINVLGLLVKLEPKQAALLEEICDGPLIPASKLASS
jgi:hypothetical protein